ncbi:MAG: HD domain-containing protein [Clostridia bacterium]|nr:HD domain-containing protein [Clostridia bacterium]
MITYEEIRKNDAVKVYIEEANRALGALGYTEHSYAHAGRVADTAGTLLLDLGYDAHTVELAKIAGYMHDIGNVVNRVDHSQSGAVMAFRILDKIGMEPLDIARIVSAIGNHDEGTGKPVNEIAAALIIADKSDVRRNRVRNNDFSTFDIHDRVNYSVKSGTLKLDKDSKTVILTLEIDPEFGSVMDYFEIFLGRMTMCKTAARTLGLGFGLVINGQAVI